MRSAAVHVHGQLAGHLVQNEEGYTFTYTPQYQQGAQAEPVSLTLPRRAEPYVARVLFPCFDGLIPEGWLLSVAERNWKLNPRDRMGLLLACCQDCIGAVSIYPLTPPRRRMSRCLFCYQPLPAASPAYHPACSRRLFGKATPPAFPYSAAQLLALAEQLVRSHITVTGVQPKLSLALAATGDAAQPTRFTLVGALGGNYILKPPTPHYPSLPEVEDLTMHLATLAGLPTVPHGLLRLEGGALAYITRRVDRHQGQKLAMEDMCQLTERLTENKYDGSHEQVAKAILKYSANPGLDVVNYYELVLFCWLTGNADMHLKNFSLLHTPGLGYGLAPAYDLVATALVNPADTEELALTLNGRKKKLRPTDFQLAAQRAGVADKAIVALFARFARVKPAWHRFIGSSFLSPELQQAYHRLLDSRFAQLGMAA